MRVILFLALMLVLSCGRPLTPQETAFAAFLHGPGLNTDPIRLGDHLAPEPSRQVPVRPPLACRDRLWPRPKGPTFQATTSALALFQTVFVREGWSSTDFLADWPHTLPLADAMLFAHEMVHVWQWQNRALTGYHPLRAALEHVASPDPYQFDPGTSAPFLSYGYEQQAAILEEFLCCAALAPQAPRTARLRAILAPYFRLPPPGAAIADRVLLPWDGAATELAGICD